MILDFYLEGAAFILGVILCVVTGVGYNIIDLKDRIYVHVVRCVTIITGLNLISYHIVRKNLFGMIGVSEFIICLSFLLMVLFWSYLNGYLLELFHNKNSFSVKEYLIIGIPVFLDLLIILANWGIHKVFYVAKVEDNIQIVFNTWYHIPYVLVAVSVVIYVILILKYFYRLSDMKQYVFLVIPFVMIIAYHLQYRFKSVSILGFGYIIVLMLMYFYSYNHVLQIDGLTRLPEEKAFEKMLDYRMASASRMMVAMVSLNDFKKVNREFGYNNGSKFIQDIAEYLEDNSPRKSCARYGGDKFAVILENYTEQQVQEWYEGILKRFENPWQIENIVHKLSVSITLVSYPDLAEDSSEVMMLLDYLNAHAKNNKKNQCIICDNTFKEKANRKIQIISILKEVMREKRIYVAYQPILDVKENKFNRAESLLRVKDEKLGYISPGEFFPIVEENGYVIEIGYILIEKVCQYIRSFIREGKEPPVISVNFSWQQIMAEDVEKKIKNILETYQIDSKYIAIELPEEVFSMQYNAVREKMIKLNDMGIHFYLDGFGAGFLDLQHLMELPFEIIKMSKSLIREAENNESIYLLVSAMTAVFEENGKHILGDGIESEQLKGIADLLFMDYLQGYYFSQPMSDELAKEYFSRENVVAKSEIDELLSDIDLDVDLNLEGMEGLNLEGIDGLNLDGIEDLDLEAMSELNVEGMAELNVEGMAEPSVEGMAEPSVEGMAEPSVEGMAEPNVEGMAELNSEGTDELK